MSTLYKDTGKAKLSRSKTLN